MNTSILLLLGVTYVYGHVTVGPRNAAVLAGQMMSMACRADEESRVRKWDLLRTDGHDSVFTVYSSVPPKLFHEEFTHFGVRLDDNGTGILYTNSTRMADAGLYTCVMKVAPQSSTIRSTALLTVFESPPICETNLTADGDTSLELGDYIWFRCNVTFRGFWAPTMEWRRHSVNGDVGTILNDGVEIVRLSNERIIYTLTIRVDSSLNGSFFSCRTYFIEYDGKALNATANNIPNYTHTWNSEAVDVPNYPFSRTTEIAIETAYWTALVVGLSAFSVCLIIAVTVVCILYNRERVKGRLLESVATEHRSSIQPNQSSNEPNPGTETEVETERPQMAATNDGYCSLSGLDSQQPMVYCQLRLQDPATRDYANIPLNEQRSTNQYPVYGNVGQ